MKICENLDKINQLADDIKPFYELIYKFLVKEISVGELETSYFILFKKQVRIRDDIFNILDRFFADLDSYSPPELSNHHSINFDELIESAVTRVKKLDEVNCVRNINK